jgi:glycopeptide antibiotics resistance protein
MTRRLLLVLWVCVIVAAVVPWANWQDHAHWPRVGWMPFLSPPLRLRDVVVNTALYVPFGWLYGRVRGRQPGGRIIEVAVWALVLSVATEASQVWSHGRFPSATDVTMNVFGAALGGWWTRKATAL